VKNVLINKICQFVVTENQLRSFWEKSGGELEFESLTNEQLMRLAKKEIDQASLRELEAHILDHGYRTRDEIEGKMIADDDSDPYYHIEVIDTSLPPGTPSTIRIDRMVRLECKDCGFEMFVQDIDIDPSPLKCPKDGGQLEINNNGNTLKKLHKEKN